MSVNAIANTIPIVSVPPKKKNGKMKNIVFSISAYDSVRRAIPIMMNKNPMTNVFLDHLNSGTSGLAHSIIPRAFIC